MQSITKKHSSALVVCLAAAFLSLSSMPPAFPLRSLGPGAKAPDFILPMLGGGESGVLGADGQITVILFWGTDTESKRSRAVELLKTLQAIGERYAAQGVVVRSVNVDKGDYDSLARLVEQEGVAVPVLLDEQEELYGAYGLFVLPTVALVERDGTLRTAIGYTHNINESVVGQVQIMLGLKTADELEKELNPEEVIEPPDNVKKAKRHLNLGRKFVAKRLWDMAKNEFEKAVELDPQNAEAHAELGGLFVRQKELDKALAQLVKALEFDPDSIQARFSLGVLYHKKGNFEKAVAELEGILEMEPAHAATLYELGSVFEDMGQNERALEHYRKALSIIFKDELIAQ